MKDENKKKEQLINELSELRGRITELEETYVDDLTGLHNLRNFFVLAEHEFARSHRYERPLTFIMLSIDNLYQITEDYDEFIVDEVLATVGERFRTSVRYVDILGRYGDEEFVLLLPEVDLTDARKIAERIRTAITGTPIETEDGSISVTISLGVSDLTANTPNLITLMECADKAMSTAKEKGGNCVEIG
ncbi:GGDEF domain-containing protein [candidate division WOR-3 bacterium]|nr:GGDEF domain-containing protein [candidate division WOR-3 bacterium]